MNAFDPVFYWSRIAPHRPALAYPGGVITYQQLCNGALHASVGLRRAGFQPKQVVALSIANPAFQIMLLLALSRFNAPAVFQDNLNRALALNADVKSYICETPSGNRPGIRTILVDHNWFVTKLGAEQTPRIDEVSAEGADIAAICASSGTTGEPKAFALTHEMLEFRTKSWLLFPEGRWMVSMLTPKTSWGLLAALRTLRSGGTYGFAPFPDQVLQLCNSTGVEFILSSTAQAATLIEEQKKLGLELPALQRIYVGGSMMSPEFVATLRKHVCRHVYSCYGSSEAGQIAGGPVSRLEGVPGAVGFVNPGIDIQVVDADDYSRVLPPGREGVLRFGGTPVIKEYLRANDDEEIIRDGWFYPGDFATLTPEGILSISGRTSDLTINKGGVKVSPVLIEEGVKKGPGILDVAAIAAMNSDGIAEIWVAVVPAATYDEKALRAHCEALMGEVAPDRFFRVDRIPRNEIGKTLYSQVKTDLAEMAKSRG